MPNEDDHLRLFVDYSDYVHLNDQVFGGKKNNSLFLLPNVRIYSSNVFKQSRNSLATFIDINIRLFRPPALT